MSTKLAIDWDENELRLVAAQCSGASIKVTDAAVIPIGDANIGEILKTAISQRGLQATDTLVAIGRGKAELRELQLPPVPDDELPDMVRFQAIRSFASSGDRATVDYLVTKRGDTSVEMIAAAIDPDNLTKIQETCQAAALTTKRIGLRPLAAAALYLTREEHDTSGDTVLIDLLSDDAEIVVARDGHVIFVRTVRMPTGEAARPKALAGELRRSLVACGSSGSLNRVVLWGLKSVHEDDLDMLAEASGGSVDVLDPFALVDVDPKMRSRLPTHVGRLAPLVGLIATDDDHADRLIDFLNPRRKVEQKPNYFQRAAIIGTPIVVASLVFFFGYRHLQTLDSKIAEVERVNAGLQPEVDEAIDRIAKTEKIDQFLDMNVNWLNELKRLATTMPASDRMILRTISATGDLRGGGGTLQVFGSVTDPSVIKSFEEALRDESHRVIGDGSTQQKSEGAYDWSARESITVPGESIRNLRYAGLAPDAQSDAARQEGASDQASAMPSSASDGGGETQPPDEPNSDSPLPSEPASGETNPDAQQQPSEEAIPDSETPSSEPPGLAAETKSEVAS